MDLGIASVFISLLIGVSGIIISIICCYLPKDRKNKIITLEKELLEAYKDIQQLLEIEKELSEECEKGKITVRRPYNISKNCQPKHVQSRIYELENKQ